MTATKYRDEILCNIILPFKQAHQAANFILVDDNVEHHHARVITAYKQANNIITEDWQVHSTDLKVIKHAWDMLQRAINM